MQVNIFFWDHIRRVLLGAGIVALLATVPIRAEDRGLMRFFSDIKGNWRTCYLGGGSIFECDSRAGYKIDPEPEPVLERKLGFLRQSHSTSMPTWIDTILRTR